MIKKTHILSGIYFLLTMALLYVIMLSKNLEQIPVKIFCSLLLGVIYMMNVSREKWDNSYFILILFFVLGDVFYSFPTRFFVVSFLFYVAIYLAFTVKIYKELKNKDWFRIFTFASPFIFTYGVIISLLENLTPLWLVVILLAGVITCINASVVVLNYASKRSKKNLLFFIGIFLIQMMNFLAVINYFNEQKQIYYLIINSLSLTAQYLICLGFIIPSLEDIKEDEEVITFKKADKGRNLFNFFSKKKALIKLAQ